MEIASAGDDALVLKRDYFSQSIDASAMEADNGNVWYDPAAQVLHAVLATQSPHEVATNAAAMVTQSKFGLKAVDLKAGYTVGYGTKDKVIFPYFCVIAGLYGDDLPVRLANDRFEQFQMGMKRHAFWIKDTLVVDRKTHRFRVMKAELKADGGGRANSRSPSALSASTATQSIYYLPKSDLSIAVLASRAVEAGSTRGSGTLQTMAATEMLVDEAAAALETDAIDLRLANVFRSGMKNTQGAVPAGALRNDEMLRKAKAHPLWAGRETRKANYGATHPAELRRGFRASSEELRQRSRGRRGHARTRPRWPPHDAPRGARDGSRSHDFAGRDRGAHPGQSSRPRVLRRRRVAGNAAYIHRAAVHDPAGDRGRIAAQSPLDAHLRVANGHVEQRLPFGHATREAALVLLRYGIWPAARALESRRRANRARHERSRGSARGQRQDHRGRS